MIDKAKLADLCKRVIAWRTHDMLPNNDALADEWNDEVTPEVVLDLIDDSSRLHEVFGPAPVEARRDRVDFDLDDDKDRLDPNWAKDLGIDVKKVDLGFGSSSANEGDPNDSLPPGHITGDQFAQSIEIARATDHSISFGYAPTKSERERRLEALVGFLWTHKGHRGSNASILRQAQDAGLGDLLQEVLPDWTSW